MVPVLTSYPGLSHPKAHWHFFTSLQIRNTPTYFQGPPNRITLGFYRGPWHDNINLDDHSLHIGHHSQTVRNTRARLVASVSSEVLVRHFLIEPPVLKTGPAGSLELYAETPMDISRPVDSHDRVEIGLYWVCWLWYVGLDGWYWSHWSNSMKHCVISVVVSGLFERQIPQWLMILGMPQSGHLRCSPCLHNNFTPDALQKWYVHYLVHCMFHCGSRL